MRKSESTERSPEGAPPASPPSANAASAASLFTPGPWRCHNQRIYAERRSIASADSPYVSVEAANANARLIAAAPALHKALSQLIDNVETGSYESTGQALDEARAVLALAAGK